MVQMYQEPQEPYQRYLCVAVEVPALCAFLQQLHARSIPFSTTHADLNIQCFDF